MQGWWQNQTWGSGLDDSPYLLQWNIDGRFRVILGIKKSIFQLLDYLTCFPFCITTVLPIFAMSFICIKSFCFLLSQTALSVLMALFGDVCQVLQTNEDQYCLPWAKWISLSNKHLICLENITRELTRPRYVPVFTHIDLHMVIHSYLNPSTVGCVVK